MDSNSMAQPILLWVSFDAIGEASLNLNRAAHRLHRAGEEDHESVATRLHHLPIELAAHVTHVVEIFSNEFDRAFFVLADTRGKVDRIGKYDRRQHPLRGRAKNCADFHPVLYYAVGLPFCFKKGKLSSISA